MFTLAIGDSYRVAILAAMTHRRILLAAMRRGYAIAMKPCLFLLLASRCAFDGAVRYRRSPGHGARQFGRRGLPGDHHCWLNQGTGIQAKTVTGDDGNYTFSNVRIGTYTVTAEAAGLLQGGRQRRHGECQRPPARRPDAAGGSGHRNRRSHGRRRGARNRLQFAQPVDQHQRRGRAAAQRALLLRSRAAHHRCGEGARPTPADAKARSSSTACAALTTTTCWMAWTTTPTAPATRASPTRWRSLRPTPSRNSR